MTHQVLSVTREEHGWRVRLNGVDVVSFSGPHAEDWAFRERDELARVLDAQPSDDLSDRHARTPLFEIVRYFLHRAIRFVTGDADRLSVLPEVGGLQRDRRSSTRADT